MILIVVMVFVLISGGRVLVLDLLQCQVTFSGAQIK
jgi:hypothetical protein